MGPGVLIASRVLGVWRFAFVEANDLPLTMGEFLGAANFIAICVMAWIMLAQSGPTEVDGLPFLRDSIMCMLVTIFMVAVTWDNLITLTESISFFRALCVLHCACPPSWAPVLPHCACPGHELRGGARL